MIRKNEDKVEVILLHGQANQDYNETADRSVYLCHVKSVVQHSLYLLLQKKRAPITNTQVLGTIFT